MQTEMSGRQRLEGNALTVVLSGHINTDHTRNCFDNKTHMMSVMPSNMSTCTRIV